MNAPETSDNNLIFRRGFGLKQEVADELATDYSSDLIERLRDSDYRLLWPEVEVRLAREFGFCYGVDRAVDYAYETRHKFPDKRLFITTEIIHNPRVNRRLLELGVRFLTGQYAEEGLGADEITPDDVVLIPAFGAATDELDRLKEIGCVLVDTTCGSVANVWRRVARYAREGYTSVIHGKYNHEETRATCSRALSAPDSKYVVVRDRAEADFLCEAIRGNVDPVHFSARLGPASAEGFQVERDLGRIGVANQTTMLSSESLAIAADLRQALLDRYGEEEIKDRFLSFDTICSATQDRQDAVQALAASGLDCLVVVGGFNSSNTTHLCEIGGEFCPTYHIDDVGCIEGCGQISHKVPGSSQITVTTDWLTPKERVIGFTAGASTPNQVVGDVITRVLELKGVTWLSDGH